MWVICSNSNAGYGIAYSFNNIVLLLILKNLMKSLFVKRMNKRHVILYWCFFFVCISCCSRVFFAHERQMERRWRRISLSGTRFRYLEFHIIVRAIARKPVADFIKRFVSWLLQTCSNTLINRSISQEISAINSWSDQADNIFEIRINFSQWFLLLLVAPSSLF